MKKLLIPTLMLGAAFFALSANAETMKGKVVGMKEGVIHVQTADKEMPSVLKTTPKTKYVEKKATKQEMAEPDDVEVDEMVEVIYAVDPTTGDMLIEEITIIDVED